MVDFEQQVLTAAGEGKRIAFTGSTCENVLHRLFPNSQYEEISSSLSRDSLLERLANKNNIPEFAVLKKGSSHLSTCFDLVVYVSNDKVIGLSRPVY